MAKTEIIKELEFVLRTLDENKYYIDSTLNKNKVIEDLYYYDEDLIDALMSSEIVLKYYTKDIKGKKIVMIEELKNLFELNTYWKDSFTTYEQTIGLNSNGKFINETSEVILNFPYKDTILKGGMTKEEVEKEEDATESYYHESIARIEIDTLLDKKILVNAKRYDPNGENKEVKFTDNDNLIIKGNNLIALNTLADRYAEKVKLIYIDPPYNTGNDSFLYNDKFNRSTWLVFMKNRLEIAWELLEKEGIIAIHIDKNEDCGGSI